MEGLGQRSDVVIGSEPRADGNDGVPRTGRRLSFACPLRTADDTKVCVFAGRRQLQK
jgi:hypothetical protein